MLQGITLVPLGMELVDKRKLLLLSLYTASFLALSVIIIHVRKKYFTELLSTRRLTIQLNSVYPDKNVIICKSPFMNTGRDNPQYSFEELMSKGCLLILQNNFLLHELLLLASLSDAAEIVSAPRNRTVLEYDNVTFFCNASSNPPSQIIWTQEGSSTVLHTGETFVIENVSRKLNGQRYKCRTWNNVTKDLEAYAQLTVHCEYSMTLS